MKHATVTTAILQFQYYKSLGEKAFEQLSEDNIHWKIDPSQNSVAIIVNHLSGNMLSRWTRIFSEDGEKPWRNRDQEFEHIINNKSEMTAIWERAWQQLFETLYSISENDIHKIIYIRNQGHTVQEAILRQLCHYSYHIGQIVLLSKMMKGDQWKSLSIAKNASKKYNNDRFNQEKQIKHFTKDL